MLIELLFGENSVVLRFLQVKTERVV